jgi:serine/threonine-protein kinase
MEGIAEVHAIGMVHRDLKPSNLFLAEGPGGTMLKVLDFGISKEAQDSQSPSLTGTESVLGTPHYMSPEQVKASRDVDARSDIWSLGVIGYELLTARLPFQIEGTSIGELFGAILHTDPREPSVYRPGLPSDLVAVIMKCMKRDRTKRYADLGELADALYHSADASNLHRFASIRRTIGSARKTGKTESIALATDTTRDPPVATKPSPQIVISSPAAGALPEAATVPPPPAVSRGARPMPASSTGVTASSWATQPGANRGPLAFVVGIPIALIVVLAGVFVLRRSHHDDVMQAPSVSPDKPTTAAATAPMTATAEAPSVDTAPSATASASAAASAPKPIGSNRPLPSPLPKKTASPVAAPAPAPAPASPKPTELILDRK